MASQLPLTASRLTLQCTNCTRIIRPSPHYLLPSRAARRRPLSTEASIAAAPEINFENLPPPSTKFARILPASASYFTAKPVFIDGLLSLQALQRKYQTLPTLAAADAPRVAWRTLIQYRVQTNEPIQAAKYHKIVAVLQRLIRIHPALMPEEVKKAIELYKRDIDPFLNKVTPGVIDEFGRSYGIGRRKSSSAKVYLVEGEGEVLVNGKGLNQAFGRIHDRESALWALKATGRMDKYNVWALVSGGGTTGQAESITLGLAKALLVHEPDLKPALRRGESIILIHVL